MCFFRQCSLIGILSLLGFAANSEIFHRQHATMAGSLFESEELLELTLIGDTRELWADRRSDEATYFDFHVQIDNDGTIPLRVKTRGHFRRDPQNCSYPPLLLNFDDSEVVKNSIFSGQDKLKLVMPCRGDKYVVTEYLAYRLYNLITPLSFRVRLVKVSFVKERDDPKPITIFGILLEDEDQMAARNNGTITKTDFVRPKEIERDNFLDLAIFEYLIGNTDWSIQYRQNIKLVKGAAEKQLKAVPYDFDHAGIVMAPYAHPAPELQLSSVRIRRYRGYCLFDMSIYEERLEAFRRRQEDFEKVLSDCKFLEEKLRKSAIKYLEQFQEIIENPKKWQQEFSYPCDENGTGKVVIRGLRN